jgi:hypothetical protein
LSPFDHRGAARASALTAAELACWLAPLALLLRCQRQALASLRGGLWGAADPWGNGDFVGNFWCWWRQAELRRGGGEWLDATGWPSGGGVLDQLFPNRVDAWLALPFLELERWWLTWNGMALIFVALTVVAVVLAARLAGASRLGAASGGLVLALSPTLLHELAWGRMASFMVWPGLLALAAVAGALRLRRWGPGLAVLGGGLLVLQAWGYPFHGLVAGLLASVVLLGAPLPWRRRATLLAALMGSALLLGLPWLLSMASDFSALAQAPPPAGYTSLPAAGLLGLPTVPERFRLLPLALPLLLLACAPRRARPWALAGLLGLGLALGPRLFWLPEGAEIPSPTGWLMAVLPWLARMHHPVRAAPIGLAAAAVAVALLLSPQRGRRPWLAWVGAAALWLAAAGSAEVSARVTTWSQPPLPPGVAAARWLAAQGDAPLVDLHHGHHMAGFTLQPWHRRPLMESVQGYTPASGGPWSSEHQALADGVRRLAGGALEPGLLRALAIQGYGHLLLVDRRPALAGAPDPAAIVPLIEAALGAPAYADGEAWAWSLDSALEIGQGGDLPVEGDPEDAGG